MDVIPSIHEDETGVVKAAVEAYLRGDPNAAFVPLKIFDRHLILHCNVDGETAHVIDVEVRN